MKHLIHAALLSLVLFLGACSASEGGEADRSQSFVDAPEITFTEVARITEPLFGVIQTVRSTPRGEIIVGDWMTRSFSVLGPDDEFMYAFGKEGEGPGEFRYLPNLIVDPDTFYTFEQWPDRVAAWVPGQTQPARIGILGESVAGRSVIAYRDGQFVLRQIEFFRPGDAPDKERFTSVSTWRTGSEVQDSLLVVPGDEMAVVSRDGMISVRSVPFGRSNLFASDSEGRIIHVWTERPEVNVYDSSMELERTIPLDYASPEFTRHDLDDYLGDYPDMESPMRRAVTDMAPEQWPAVRQLIVDDQDRIWIGLRTPSSEPTRWLALTSEGEIVGQAELPDDLRLHVVRGNTAYGVYPEDLDVGGPVLVRMEVEDDLYVLSDLSDLSELKSRVHTRGLT